MRLSTKGRSLRCSIAALAVACLTSCNTAPNQPASPTGRYSIVYSPHIQRSTMLLDTATGKTWNLVTLGEEEDSGYGWEPVPLLRNSSAQDSN